MSETSGVGAGLPERHGAQNGRSADRDVNFFQALGLGLKNFFRFTGRSSRGAFWWWIVWTLVFSGVSLTVDTAFGNRIVGALVTTMVDSGVPVADNGGAVDATPAQDGATTAQPGTATTAGGAETPAGAETATTGTETAMGADTATAAQQTPPATADTTGTNGATAAPPELPEASPIFLVIPAVLIVIGIILIIPTITVKIRRLHDTGLSGWYILFNLVPFFGFLIVLALCARAPTAGPNKYGEFAEAGRD